MEIKPGKVRPAVIDNVQHTRGWTFSVMLGNTELIQKGRVFRSAAEAKQAMRDFVRECNGGCDHPGYPICPCTEPESWNSD